MVSLSIIMSLLNKGDWLASLDLQDVYFHVTILPRYCKYLSFCIGGAHYQYKALSFRISTAPRVFMKTIMVLVAFLHTKGVMLFPYIDSWLLLAPSEVLLSQYISLTLLQRFGLRVNFEKSQLTPLHKTKCIGVILYSTICRAFIPWTVFLPS